jgi:hypothetical protein
MDGACRFKLVIEILPDIVIDLPQSPNHVAAFFTDLIAADAMTLSAVHDLLTTIHDNPVAERVFATVIEGLSNKMVWDGVGLVVRCACDCD